MPRWGVALVPLLIGLAAAQPQFDPERLAAMQPIFDLAGTVNLLVEMQAEPELAVDDAQASALLTLLSDLQVVSDLPAEDAGKRLRVIEEEIMTLEQLLWLDRQFLERQARGEGQQGFGGGRPGGGPGGGGPQGEGGGQPGAGRGGLFQRLAADESPNLFLQPPLSERLAALLELLQRP